MSETRRSTRLLRGPVGDLEFLTTGRGSSSSVFVHGLASSIDATRPFASLVAGRRTFVHLRGHGRSTSPARSLGVDGWAYSALAADLAVVADSVGATRAFGVSMGAGAICALLSGSPSRFERVVLALPASIDEPLERDVGFEAMADAWEAGDRQEIARRLISSLPTSDRASSGEWAQAEAMRLLDTPGLGAGLRSVPWQAPLLDRSTLALVSANVLVIGQAEDPAHPAWVTSELASCFPHAQAVILPPGGILHRHRAAVRVLVRDALA